MDYSMDRIHFLKILLPFTLKVDENKAFNDVINSSNEFES